MNKRKLKHFEKLLREMREEQMKNIRILEGRFSDTSIEKSGDLSAHTYHLADRATDANRMEKNSISLTKATETIKCIDEALKEIIENEGKQYGICESCGEKIPEERLELVPYTKLCVKCQAEKENS